MHPLLLGVDTGGTYTDAVLIGSHQRVVAAAKSRTTHHQLDLGVGKAIRACLSEAGISGEMVAAVSVSTTLATNAMVEQLGARGCLVTIGFDASAIARIDGLRADDKLISVRGGHHASGTEASPIDVDGLRSQLRGMEGVAGVAVASMFAVRNSEHEQQARAVVRELTGLPVTCTHELSAALHGPKRAATALANARLIPRIVDLVSALRSERDALGIVAPIVVVRSDGSVMSEVVAVERPVETILSGPAASIIGARHLTGESDAVVVDIGGTTTDIAVIHGGVPELADGGAVVGGIKTMVHAAVVRTVGLGGDSRVGLHPESAQLQLGPRRVEPLCRAALEHPELLEKLRLQAKRPLTRESDGTFFIQPDGSLVDAALAFESRRGIRWAEDRVDRGEFRIVGFTPTDAAHVLGLQSGGDVAAAHLGAELFARRKDRFGSPVSSSAEALAKQVVQAVQIASARQVALATDVPEAVIDHVLDDDPTWVAIHAALSVPIIGVGASADIYHRPMEDLLHTTVLVPDHARVANAVGAAVGSVRVEVTATITQPDTGVFRVHGAGIPSSHETLDQAAADAIARVTAAAREQALRSGANGPVDVEVTRRDTVVTMEHGELFVESQIVASAHGAPGSVRSRAR